jgi:hypothetical protein
MDKLRKCAQNYSRFTTFVTQNQTVLKSIICIWRKEDIVFQFEENVNKNVLQQSKKFKLGAE